MKVIINISNKVAIEAEGATHKDIFEQIASLQEAFGAYDKCGKCGCDNLRFIVRTDEESNSYYELQCLKCYAKLSFGQNKGDKNGNLYPRRFENKKKSVMKGNIEAGAKLPSDGWLKYNKEKDCLE
jgi:hypothetical protein